MKRWLETRQVLDRLAELHSAGRGGALATVIRVRGSAYRHEGAKMIVAADRTSVGNVSGGCLEADVRECALQVLESGRTMRREYCASADDVSAWDLGVGCEGMVEVLIEPALHPSPELVEARRLMLAREPFALCTDLETGARAVVSPGATAGEVTIGVAAAARALFGVASGIHTIDGRDVFIDVFTPSPILLVVGAGDDARSLVRVASDVGFHVVVADRRSGLLTEARFPGAEFAIVSAEDLVVPRGESYAVVMTHNYADDRDYVGRLMTSDVRYVGLLGPRQRKDRIVAELGLGDSASASRLFGPVGLDIGTDGAEQVALAVIAEILAVRSGRRPTSLRERSVPIHAESRV